MKPAALLGRSRRDGRGRQEGMGEQDPVASKPDDAGPLRGFQVRADPVGIGEHLVEEPERWLSQQRHHQQAAPHSCAQRRQPGPHRIGEGVREREGLRPAQPPAGLDRLGDLQDEQRVATRGLVDPEEDRPGEGDAELAAEDGLQRPHAERADRQPS